MTVWVRDHLILILDVLWLGSEVGNGRTAIIDSDSNEVSGTEGKL